MQSFQKFQVCSVLSCKIIHVLGIAHFWKRQRASFRWRYFSYIHFNSTREIKRKALWGTSHWLHLYYHRKNTFFLPRASEAPECPNSTDLPGTRSCAAQRYSRCPRSAEHQRHRAPTSYFWWPGAWRLSAARCRPAQPGLPRRTERAASCEHAAVPRDAPEGRERSTGTSGRTEPPAVLPLGGSNRRKINTTQIVLGKKFMKIRDIILLFVKMSLSPAYGYKTNVRSVVDFPMYPVARSELQGKQAGASYQCSCYSSCMSLFKIIIRLLISSLFFFLVNRHQWKKNHSF